MQLTRELENMLSFTQDVVYQTLDAVFHHIPNAEKKFENTTRCLVFLVTFEVFGNVVNTVSSV